MTKAEIKANNDMVLSVLDDFDDVWNSITHGRPFPFRNCQAHTSPYKPI